MIQINKQEYEQIKEIADFILIREYSEILLVKGILFEYCYQVDYIG